MSNDGEHRMLFDLRGRRRNVVKVVYAILALLMGLSLFLVIGPAPLSDLFGTGTSSSSAAEQFEEQAARLERKLKKDPEDPQLLLNLTRARTNAGNSLSVVNQETGESALTVPARQELLKAAETWESYLKATDEPSPSGAQLASSTLFRLAQTSRTPAEIEANLEAAAAAQQIVADRRPGAGTLATLALYRFFTFDYETARKLIKEAGKAAATKGERQSLAREAKETEASARALQKQLAEFEKASKGQGKEAIENPLGGLGGGSSVLSE
jgi:tetratricopeptide (TPR) repeat protein